MKWGWWRLFTCKLAGASRQLIYELCDDKQAVQKALHAILADVEYRYGGLADFHADVVEANLLVDAELVCQGKGERVVDGVMDWIETVRIRAWQDLGARNPQQFCIQWTTKLYKH